MLPSRRPPILSAFLVALLAAPALAQDRPLGSAEAFAVLAGSAVTNRGFSIISGELGVWPGLAVSGFPPGIVVGGAIHNADLLARQAQLDAVDAANALAALPRTADLTSRDLGGLTLPPGVYFFESSAALTGTLTLDALGDPDARFVFQIGSTLTVAPAAAVVPAGGADRRNIYWQVGSSAFIGAGADFQGAVLAYASITLENNAAVAGGLYARNGAVTLDANRVRGACIADFNRDGFIDFFDYDDFVTCFETAACPDGRTADVDGDGFADFFDYDRFVLAFEDGC